MGLILSAFPAYSLWFDRVTRRHLRLRTEVVRTPVSRHSTRPLCPGCISYRGSVLPMPGSPRRGCTR